MKKLNKDGFLHATEFIYFCITAVCYVKTKSNDRCSETRFVLFWCMLFFSNPLQHASCVLSLRFVFPVWKWGARMSQKSGKLIRKFWKFTVSSISRFDNNKEVWNKDWKMSLYKPGQVRTCFCWIIEKSQIIQITISFHNDNFCVDLFEDANSVIFSSDFFSVNYWNY